MSKVSVIVVSWNVREQLFHCLQSVTAQPPLDIIVIDNNSSDGSSQMVANKFPQVNHFLETTGCLELLFLRFSRPTCLHRSFPPLRVFAQNGL